MPVTSVITDAPAASLTLTATFAAPVERVWQVWSDPRQLERWWGPPTYPATVVEHDLTPGGRITYFMTGPEGDIHHGWWRVLEVDPPHRLRVEDGFGDSPDQATPGLPTSNMTLTLVADQSGGTLMPVVGSYADPQGFAQVLAMGMEEGMTSAAVNQIDALLSVPAV
ncbi:MAG: SRPBCC domain-containing protein [Candidatus Nanopelagicales bacterium]